MKKKIFSELKESLESCRDLKKCKVTKIEVTKLQSGRIVPKLKEEVSMTIASKTPDKWLFVDLETGDVWHRGEIDMWRFASKKELRELRELRKLKYQ